MEQLPLFPPFSCEDKESAGPRWSTWVERLENLFVGMKIEDGKRQRALLLHYAGERVYDIYNANKGATAAEYDATKKVLNDYFAPKKNPQIEIFNFRSYKQRDTQTLDEYVTELRRLAKNCEFGDNVDKEILSQVIQCCKSSRLRRRALREGDKDLDHILTLGRTLEMADQQAAMMERESDKETVNKLQNKFSKPIKKGGRLPQNKPNPGKTMCRKCGGVYPHSGKCPALGKICNFCKKKNHFKSVCRNFKDAKEKGRKVAQVSVPSESESSDEDPYCYTVEFVGKVKNAPTTELLINQKKCQMLIDTGASVNILDEQTYKTIGSPKLNTKVNPKLIPYGGNAPLKVNGECILTVETKDKIACEKFYDVPGSHGSLLGFEAAQELNLVKIVNKVTNPCENFPELFKGIGKLKNHKVKLHIDESVKPVANCHRRTPFHLRDKVERT